MLILETSELDDKGAHYYQNGYLCPSTSRAPRPSQPESEDQGRDHTTQKLLSGDKLLSRKQQQQLQTSQPQSSTSGGAPSSPHPGGHSLFMQVDTEREEEQSDFSPLWGLRGWPAVFCYPNNEPPLQHWPNIVSLIMDNRQALETTRPV